VDHNQLVRQVVPFAAALQGRLMLHAAAVSIGRRCHAFIGASGAGKSTLAARLEAEGCALLSEDLLPCEIVGGAIQVPHSSGRTAPEPVPLEAVHFLERVPGITNLSLERLDRLGCLRLLLRHGFGELAVPRVWAVQFEHYQAIASQCQAFRLVMPDDLSLLPRAVAQLAQRLDSLDDLPGTR